jgi:hypothetical protein
MADLVVPDPTKLLKLWMEWEKGEEMPGQVLANLKKAGMRDLLDQLAAAAEPARD